MQGVQLRAQALPTRGTSMSRSSRTTLARREGIYMGTEHAHIKDERGGPVLIPLQFHLLHQVRSWIVKPALRRQGR